MPLMVNVLDFFPTDVGSYASHAHPPDIQHGLYLV